MVRSDSRWGRSRPALRAVALVAAVGAWTALPAAQALGDDGHGRSAGGHGRSHGSSHEGSRGGSHDGDRRSGGGRGNGDHGDHGRRHNGGWTVRVPADGAPRWATGGGRPEVARGTTAPGAATDTVVAVPAANPAPTAGIPVAADNATPDPSPGPAAPGEQASGEQAPGEQAPGEQDPAEQAPRLSMDAPAPAPGPSLAALAAPLVGAAVVLALIGAGFAVRGRVGRVD